MNYYINDELTPDEESIQHLQENPTLNSSLWAGWVCTVCVWDKIALPTSEEWEYLKSNFHFEKTPTESVEELKAIRKIN